MSATAWDPVAAGGDAPERQPHAASPSDRSEWRSLLLAMLLAFCCDWTVYRGEGYCGLAVFLVIAPPLLALGIPATRGRGYAIATTLMTLTLALKLIWCGSAMAVLLGFALVVASAMSFAGHTPHVLETLVFASQTFAAGYRALSHYARIGVRFGLPVTRVRWLSILLPAIVFMVFGLLFVFANPDLLESVWAGAHRVLKQLRGWLLTLAPGEVLFWGFVVWLALGLMRPVAGVLSAEVLGTLVEPVKPRPRLQSPLYAAFRNTLLAVIGLFAVYLVFEFRTLWFREFPPGFYYSGYAHNGAAWLTVALAVSTLVLSLIFRSDLLGDPRVPKLRKLAWIWSLENFILAAAVYNRLLIYVHFNGMSRMRMVGFFGITTVVVGFALVVYKIAHDRRFLWLLRGHLWTLSLAAYLFVLTPVDALVTRYNVRRILAGDPAPSVQISVHPLTSEGILLLSPLLDCDDAQIREGIRALLAEKDIEVEAAARSNKHRGWTAFQWADAKLRDHLRAQRHLWSQYTDPKLARQARDAFDDYAYQWY